MIDNFELIKPLFWFDEKDNMFFHCQIVQRAKDHKPNKVREGAIKTYFIRSREHLNNIKDEIILLCEHYGARAYINVSSKEFWDMQKLLLMKLARNITEDIIQNPKKILKSVTGELNKSKRPLWVVDIDDLSIKDSILNWLDKENYNTDHRNGRYLYVRAEIPTPQGCHLITTPFNTKTFSETFPSVDVHKNSMGTLLYYPKSLELPKYCCSICGGTNIQLQAWIDPNNNNNYIEGTEDSECWCENCQEHTKIKLINYEVD